MEQVSFISDDGRTNVLELKGKESSSGDFIAEYILRMSLVSVTYLLEIISTRGNKEILQLQCLVFQISKKARKVLFEDEIRSALTLQKIFNKQNEELLPVCCLIVQIIKHQKLCPFVKLFVFKVTEI